MRTLPHVPLSPCPADYARFLGEGWDSVQEVFDIKLSPGLVAMMEEAQLEARNVDLRGEGLAPLRLGETDYRMRARGTRGSRWVLESEAWILMIASPGTNWPLSIRYLSHALWREGGVETLRGAAIASLHGHISQFGDDYVRLTRADYCFDFHSPAFTAEHKPGALWPRVVAHAKVKAREHPKVEFDADGIGTVTQGQTLTLGSRAFCQVQIYNKSDEITEVSGKQWLYELWARAVDGEVLDRDVHRLEVRFGSAFLKERNLRTPAQAMVARREIVTEALFRIRLTEPSADSNRRRWPMHPLWSEAVRRCGTQAMVPLGRVVTGHRDALVEQSRATIAGTLRSHCALKFGRYERDEAIGELNRIIGVLENDEDHGEKLDQALLRYRDVEGP